MEGEAAPGDMAITWFTHTVNGIKPEIPDWCPLSNDCWEFVVPEDGIVERYSNVIYTTYLLCW